MKWQDCDMEKAIKHACGRTVDEKAERPIGTYFSSSCVCFTDGTAIACASEWSGPYSEVTPDIDADDPSWRIYC